jgi:hypothetical protein
MHPQFTQLLKIVAEIQEMRGKVQENPTTVQTTFLQLSTGIMILVKSRDTIPISRNSGVFFPEIAGFLPEIGGFFPEFKGFFPESGGFCADSGVFGAEIGGGSLLKPQMNADEHRMTPIELMDSATPVARSTPRCDYSSTPKHLPWPPTLHAGREGPLCRLHTTTKISAVGGGRGAIFFKKIVKNLDSNIVQETCGFVRRLTSHCASSQLRIVQMRLSLWAWERQRELRNELAGKVWGRSTPG